MDEIGSNETAELKILSIFIPISFRNLYHRFRHNTYTHIDNINNHDFFMASCESAIPLDSCYMLRHTERRDSRSHGGSQLALREQSLTLREREEGRETVEKRD